MRAPAGKALYAWTCNEAEMLVRALDVGVDALVTSYPRLALAAVEHRIGLCGGVPTAVHDGL